jgi:hypothetical protein
VLAFLDEALQNILHLPTILPPGGFLSKLHAAGVLITAFVWAEAMLQAHGGKCSTDYVQGLYGYDSKDLVWQPHNHRGRRKIVGKSFLSNCPRSPESGLSGCSRLRIARISFRCVVGHSRSSRLTGPALIYAVKNRPPELAARARSIQAAPQLVNIAEAIAALHKGSSIQQPESNTIWLDADGERALIFDFSSAASWR